VILFHGFYISLPLLSGSGGLIEGVLYLSLFFFLFSVTVAGARKANQPVDFYVLARCCCERLFGLWDTFLLFAFILLDLFCVFLRLAQVVTKMKSKIEVIFGFREHNDRTN